MTNKIFFIGTILLSLFLSSYAQDDVTLFNYWKYYSDAENSLYKHLSSVAFEQLELRKKEISKLKTAEDWKKRQSLTREKLLQNIGPFPEKTPLNARVTGVIKKDGYHVENILFESIPGYYVTAALFIPDKIKGKSPAILNAIGHSTKSYRRDIYQH
jgi:Abhydrolase family